MTNRLLNAVFVLLLACGAACSSEQPQTGSNTANTTDERLLIAENFDDYEDGALPSDWWVEGAETVYVSGGKLRIEADPDTERAPGYVATVWNRHEFSGDLRVEFDAHVLVSSLDVNNINFFFLYTHPGADSTLYGTRGLRRDGSYGYYHDLNGYIFTFVKSGEREGDARFRMRRCPGFELIDENHTFESRPGRTYHVTITKEGTRLTYAVNGTAYLQSTDEKYNWAGGRMGVRTFHTDLWIDNFTVTQLTD